jgi:hypothetical protein
MAKKLTETMTFDATCADVFAMMTHEDYVAKKIEGTGGSDATINVVKQGSDVVVEAGRNLPAQVPSFMKSFVGDAIRVDEVDRWSPADDLGARTAQVTINFAGTPASATGTLDLRPASDGAEVIVNFDVKASVPLVGGKIEGVIVEQISRAIRKENEIGVEWLSQS